MSRLRTHYDNLQVSRNASNDVIRAAYQKLSQLHHPDKNPNNKERAERRIKIINEAYEVLSDAQKRCRHDAWIKDMESSFDRPLKEASIDIDFITHKEFPAFPSVRVDSSPTHSEYSVSRVKIWWILAFLIVVSGAAGGIGKVVGKFVFGGDSTDIQEELQKELTIAAKNINARGPLMVNKVTRLDRATAGPGAQLTYYYTLIVKNLDKKSIDLHKSRVRYDACTNKMAKSLRLGAVYRYHYTISGRKRNVDFSVQKKHCDALFEKLNFYSEGWTMESSGKTFLNPSLEEIPPGTRYGRMENGIIYRYFPPGARSDTEKAIPFDLDHSTVLTLNN